MMMKVDVASPMKERVCEWRTSGLRGGLRLRRGLGLGGGLRRMGIGPRQHESPALPSPSIPNRTSCPVRGRRSATALCSEAPAPNCEDADPPSNFGARAGGGGRIALVIRCESTRYTFVTHTLNKSLSLRLYENRLFHAHTSIARSQTIEIYTRLL